MFDALHRNPTTQSFWSAAQKGLLTLVPKKWPKIVIQEKWPRGLGSDEGEPVKSNPTFISLNFHIFLVFLWIFLRFFFISFHKIWLNAPNPGFYCSLKIRTFWSIQKHLHQHILGLGKYYGVSLNFSFAWWDPKSCHKVPFKLKTCQQARFKNLGSNRNECKVGSAWFGQKSTNVVFNY